VSLARWDEDRSLLMALAVVGGAGTLCGIGLLALALLPFVR
jgi:hypothetical protein